MLRKLLGMHIRSKRGDPVAAQARRWHAVMAADRDVADHLAAFSAWLDASPAHAQAFVALCRAPRERPGWGRVHGGGLRRGWAMGLAAAGVAGMLAFVTLPPGADISVAAGTWESRMPGDGSQVQFGPGTQARLDFSGPRRTIRLDSGAVIVEAAKDAERPLIVQTEHGSVRVVGTRFVVVVDASGTEVTVTRGKVEVAPAAASEATAALTAAQRVHFTATTLARRAAPITETEEIRDGWRSFDAAPLADLARAVGAETGRRMVVLPSATRRAAAITGRFHVHDGRATLALLHQAYGLRHTDMPLGVTVLY